MVNEKRLIDANALKKHMCFKCNDEYSDEPCEPSDCVFFNAINDAPTVDAVEVVHGRWEEPYPLYLVCSECGTAYVKYEKYNYCPNCGAKMDGDGNA